MLVGLCTGTIYSAKFVTKWVFFSYFWGWGPGKLCWQIRCFYIHFLLHHRGRGPAWLQFLGATVLIPFPSKRRKVFVIAWNHAVFLTCPSITPTHLPTLHFPRFTTSVEMRFVIVGSVSLAWQHVIGEQLLASFCCVTFSYSLISFCTFLLIGWLNLITFTLLCPMICNLGTSTQSIIFYNDSIMRLVTKNSPNTYTPWLFILTHE